MAGGFGYDPHDADWETGDGHRTVYDPAKDDDYCEVCDSDIVNDRCQCDAGGAA
jgi:hypothetical protein